MYRLIAAACALLIAVPAFADDDQARVRVIHALPGGQAVNVSIGGQQVFQNVQHKQVTEFKALTGDNHELKITSATGSPIEASVDGRLDPDDNDYTIVVMANSGTDRARPLVKVLKIDGPDDDMDEAELSLINASQDVKAADLLIAEKKVHAGVNPGGINGKDDIEPGNKQLKVFNGRENTEIFSQSMNLEGGKRYTAVVFGTNEALIIDDARPQVAGGAGAMGAPAGGTATQPQTRPTTPGAAPAEGATEASGAAPAPRPANQTSPNASSPAQQGESPTDSAAQNMSGVSGTQSHTAPSDNEPNY